MTRKELEERLAKLEHERFLMDMIDRWMPCDWERVNRLNTEILETKRTLETITA